MFWAHQFIPRPPPLQGFLPPLPVIYSAVCESGNSKSVDRNNQVLMMLAVRVSAARTLILLVSFEGICWRCDNSQLTLSPPPPRFSLFYVKSKHTCMLHLINSLSLHLCLFFLHQWRTINPRDWCSTETLINIFLLSASVVLGNITKACLGMVFNKSVLLLLMGGYAVICDKLFNDSDLAHNSLHGKVEAKMKQDHYTNKEYSCFVNYIIWNVPLQLQSIFFFFPISTAALQPCLLNCIQPWEILTMSFGIYLVSSDLLLCSFN